MGTTAPGRAGPRALAVLAVLLGLLAMHGLASTHHVAAAAPQPVGTEHAAPPVDRPDHDHAVPDASGLPLAAAPADPSCDRDCLDTAVLCVAVLSAAALLLRQLARHRPAAPSSLPAIGLRTTTAPLVRHARGPDPVTELCVSRT